VSGVPKEGPDELVGRVQELQERLDSAGDPATREVAEELVSAIVQMYGAGLEQIVAVLGDADPALAGKLADDPLVATLLMIHDLHPVPLEVRVAEALERVRPYMESHGGNVELLDLRDGVARIRLQGSCSSCSASSVTLELAIKQALEEVAPDLEGLDVEGIEPAPVTAPAAAARMDRLPLAEPPAPAWFDVGSVGALPAGELTVAEIGGSRLVVANVDGTLLAYRDACAECGGPLHDGDLEAGALRCRQCSRIYFLPRAGRSMDDDRLQLEPVPLLRDQDMVKVALAT
jgi:Fe-S cluster biogenesis protein NfuA/nitrite reductase/ring-hydroxylating ferredoxin subunit